MRYQAHHGGWCIGRGTGMSRPKTTPWIFVDCEARGVSPVNGTLTEFGAVH
jgi:hypothetical protein